jgi:hypothetical protein
MLKSGHNPRGKFSSAEWAEKVRVFIANTIRSVNFMRSGWLPAAKAFDKVCAEGKESTLTSFGRSELDERVSNPKSHDYEMGNAITAHWQGDTVVAIARNRAVNPRNKTSWSLGLGKYGVKGLQDAIAYKAADMVKWLADDWAHFKRTRT